MIGHFPDPYPDELLYSTCARFADQVQYSSIPRVLKDLFGTPAFPGCIHLPTHLDHLISILPPDHPYSSDFFIDEHTLFPFYAPFLQPEDASKIREDMHLNQGQGIQTRIGRVAYQQWPEQLRFCPRCVEEDRQHFGECYWHRVHQILGVEACPLHACYLLNSGIHAHQRLRSLRLISAERSLSELKLPLSHTPEDCACEHHLAIARDAYWLLNQKGQARGLKALAQHYRHVLAQQDIATYRGIIRRPTLMEKFTNFYPVEFLKRLDSELVWSGGEDWLLRLLKTRILHPVRHLLLMRFLGYTVEAFFTGATKALPFGNGPWPCLNPVCKQYHQSCIEHCTITSSWYKHAGRETLKGTFKCTCGFAYTRIGPDQSDEDRLRLNRVLTCGPIWEAALKQLWDNPLLEHKEVARQLGVSPGTLRTHAARLALTFPRPGGRAAFSDKYCPHPRSARIIHPEKLATYRKEWLAARDAFPEAGTTFLRKHAKAAYLWLIKHDTDWLKAQQPVRKSSKMRASYRLVDWGQRDVQWTSAVEAGALRLKKSPGRPIRITRSAIAREMGLPGYLLGEANLEKLPLTEKALLGSLESAEAFAFRQIRWAAARYRQEHLVPTKARLLRSSVAWRLRESPLVQQTADEELRMLTDEEPWG